MATDELHLHGEKNCIFFGPRERSEWWPSSILSIEVEEGGRGSGGGGGGERRGHQQQNSNKRKPKPKCKRNQLIQNVLTLCKEGCRHYKYKSKICWN